MRKGIGVSPGVVIGKAYCIHEIFVNPKDAAAWPKTRFLPSYAASSSPASKRPRTCALHQKVASQVGTEQAAVFQAHETILHDPAFTAKVRERIVDHRETAPAVLEHVLGAYTELFTRMDDEYLRERLVDVRDVIIRLSGHLSPVLAKDPEDVNGPLILVATELLPSQVVALGKREVAGIVTQSGGQTSHAAILAAAAASRPLAACKAFFAP